MARHKTPAPYPSHLQALLSLGDPLGRDVDAEMEVDEDDDVEQRDDWLDYRTLGVADADVPELLRLLRDPALRNAAEPQCWAPLHAWRALASLEARDAAAPLLDALDSFAKQDDDWSLDEIPAVLAAIGPSALPELRKFLPDQRRRLWARVGAAQAMTAIAQADPSHRKAVVESLAAQLGLAEYNNQALNESIVRDLVELKATEAAGAIQDTYLGGHVDPSMCGSLDDVMAEMGLFVAELPIPSDIADDERAVAEVMAESNAKHEAELKHPEPRTTPDLEQMAHEISAMMEARAQARRSDAASAPD